jgi:glycerophosphoryl diester phosphodiesterase
MTGISAMRSDMTASAANGSSAPLSWPLGPIAHRGLHNADQGVLENTPSAISAALAKGYAIEVDLQSASDGSAVVFHDETIDRLMDGSGDVVSFTPAQLQKLHYRESRDRIVLLPELLALVNGRVPLFIEVKTLFGPSGTSTPGAYEAGIAAALSAYRGPVAVMSFDPVALQALRSAAPLVPRGLISYRWDDDWMPQIPAAERNRLRRMTSLDTLDAAFVAYDIDALPEPEPLAFRASGRPLLAWTVRTPEQRQKAQALCDAIIFEGFEPETQPHKS